MGNDDAQRIAGTSLDLDAMLELLARTIVRALGFDVAVVNLVESTARVAVVAVAGPDAVREKLLGTHVDVFTWERLFEAGQPWGRLVFVDHRVFDASQAVGMVSWTPDTAVSDDPDGWHPEDSLFAPLRSSDGALLGVLSVDLPRGGRRPDEDTRNSLEAFGVSAALAIEHATLRVRAERSEELFREVFSASPLGMALVDDQGAIVVGNGALCRFLQREPTDLTGHQLGDFKHPEDSRRQTDQTKPPLFPAGRDAERFVTADGSVVYGEVTQSLLRGGARVVIQIRDVTEQREAVSRLQHLATHDAATGVGNRSLLLQRLRAAIDCSKQTRATIALLFIDLDGFKRLNDDFSHSVGDQVLLTVAQRLIAAVRPEDCVVRWGGDEFIVMVAPLRGAQVAVDLAGRIGEALSAPVQVGADRAAVTASIGVAYRGPDDLLDVDDLLRNADTAMYRAKREPRSSFSVFDVGIAEGSGKQARHLEDLVRSAIERDRIVVHYQPVVGIESGAVRGVEALMRLRDDDGELLYPASFLATAEESGDFEAMAVHALRQACRDVAECSSLGFPLQLSVNVGLSQLEISDDFVKDVREALDDAGLPPSRLTLELCERSLSGLTSRTRRTLLNLVDIGVGLGIDDFGSASGSSVHLRTLPLREIKIARRFVQQSPFDRVSTAVIGAYASLAHDLGVACVATGVETQEQHDFLRSTSIDLAQGFLYEQPVRVTALLDYLRDSMAVSRPGS